MSCAQSSEHKTSIRWHDGMRRWAPFTSHTTNKELHAAADDGAFGGIHDIIAITDGFIA